MTNGVGDVALAGLPLPLSLGYSFVGGYYTTAIYPEDQAIILSLAVKKSMPEDFQNEVKGMFITGSVSIEPFNKTYDLSVAGTGVTGKVVIGVAGESRSYLKYLEGTSARIFGGNYSYGGVTLEGSATLLGIGVYAGANANIQISQEASIDTPNFLKGTKSLKQSLQSLKLEGCGSITMGVFLGVSTPLGDAGIDVEKTISAKVGYKNNKPHVSFGFDECGNGMPSNKIEKF
jgi:FlaG/FlaF family flagellin (archaellin)